MVEVSDPKDMLGMICAPMPTFNEFISVVREGMGGKVVNPVWKHVRDWYEEQEPWQERLTRVEEWIGYTNQIRKVEAKRLKSYMVPPCTLAYLDWSSTHPVLFLLY